MKTGLVLEGGALRTIYSTGVMDAMLSKDLMVDYVIGVSAGIAYGVSYVSKQPQRNLEILTRFVNDRRYMGLKIWWISITAAILAWSSPMRPSPTNWFPLTMIPLPPFPDT